MKIEDFMVCTGPLAKFNYALIKDNENCVQELKEMGCTDKEIELMRNSEDNYLDVYNVLINKGYIFSPGVGFLKIN